MTTASFVRFAKAEIEQSIPSRFERQVARHADRLAVRTASHSFTYHQLDALANTVAHGILARRGEGSEPIALLMEQGAPLMPGRSSRSDARFRKALSMSIFSARSLSSATGRARTRAARR